MKKVIIPILIAIAILSIGAIVYDQYINSNKNLDNTPYYTELGYDTLKEKIDNKDSFILLIHQTNCPYCEQFLPVYKAVADENELQVYAINRSNLSNEGYDYLKELASITGTPTTIFIENGVETTATNRIVGAATRSTFIKKLKSLGYVEG